MAEASKVRLVRCPKCENLLPELPDFSLYQCGGCGAVLKAKKKGIMDDGLSSTSGEAKGGVIPEEDDGIVKVSKVEMDGVDAIEDGGVERIETVGSASNGTSTSPPENREAPDNTDTNGRGKARIRSRDDSDEEYGPYRNFHGENRNRNNNHELSLDGSEYGNFHGENVNSVRPPMDSSRSRPLTGVKSNGPAHGPARGVSAQARFDDFLYCDEGQSSYGMNSFTERTRYRGHNLDGLDRIEHLDNGRAELLRKLDELKDQIARSCDMAERPKEKIGIYQRMVSPTSSDPYGGPPGASLQGVNGQLPSPDDMVPPYFSHPSGLVPYSDRYNSRVPPYYPYYSNGGYPRGPQSQYMQQPFREHFPGYYSDINHDNFMFHRHENFFHQPACSCVHCCDKNWHMPPRVDHHPGLTNRRAQNEPPNPNFHHPNPILHRPQAMQSRQSLTRNSSDLDSENDGFNYHRPRKLVVPQRSGRVSYPVRGGAPFITCRNCFELLKLPRKHISMEKDEQKMKCGACSSMIVFGFSNKGLVSSFPAGVDQLPTEIDQVSSGTVDENVIYWNNCSNDYDDFDPNLSPTQKKSTPVEKELDPLSSTSSLSEDERGLENVSSRKHDLPNRELTLEELTDHSQENTVVSRLDKRGSLDRTTSLQNSVRDGAVATDTDVSLNAFSNSNVSQDSVEVSREDPVKVSKGGESFFAGLIKKSFKKSNQGGEVGRSHVFVNGHLIPDRLVKKAEKLAGPIQPGEYWYDKQAGFWGVMGHPCFGIVMPNIEEFNYPLPKNCAAGNTGVFVNGRELHQKDLDLLASRGLPITKNRSYLIEITGKVVDEQTGEELDGLGKLAPTVERAKHGFGMKVPTFIAQSKS